jgi:LPXTG-motif cell wall-anchored protein
MRGVEPLGREGVTDRSRQTGIDSMDFVFLAGGLALFALFGLYAVVLRRV